LHHSANFHAGQSVEGHFEQLWNQLAALRESKLLGPRSGRNDRIKKAFHPIPLVAPDRTQNSGHYITPQTFKPGCYPDFEFAL
jgi:hypothetical protein